jgi:hypothetical protein
LPNILSEAPRLLIDEFDFDCLLENIRSHGGELTVIQMPFVNAEMVFLSNHGKSKSDKKLPFKPYRKKWLP